MQDNFLLQYSKSFENTFKNLEKSLPFKEYNIVKTRLSERIKNLQKKGVIRNPLRSKIIGSKTYYEELLVNSENLKLIISYFTTQDRNYIYLADLLKIEDIADSYIP